jgi:molybdopterin-guanine dinucleotide biosynthesis protein A
MWSAAILAGGQARRLAGRDKAALHIGASAILERQLALLHTVVNRILIVANDQARYARYGVPVVGDIVTGAGVLGGLYTAISAVGTPRTLVIACDLPFLTSAFLSRLIAEGEEVDVLLPRTAEGFQPLCATYSDRAGVQIGLQIQAGIRKVVDAVRGADGLVLRELGPHELAPYDRDGTLFFNVNTPDDYARAIDLEASRRFSSFGGPPKPRT